jgi:hypothetical protein
MTTFHPAVGYLGGSPGAGSDNAGIIFMWRRSAKPPLSMSPPRSSFTVLDRSYSCTPSHIRSALLTRNTLTDDEVASILRSAFLGAFHAKIIPCAGMASVPTSLSYSNLSDTAVNVNGSLNVMSCRCFDLLVRKSRDRSFPVERSRSSKLLLSLLDLSMRRSGLLMRTVLVHFCVELGV